MTVRVKEKDPRQLANELLGNEDFVDAPAELQSENIRELATTMHNKKEVKQEVKQAKNKEKKPSVFKTMGYSVSLVSFYTWSLMSILEKI